MTQAELVFETRRRMGNKEKLLAVLSDGAWHFSDHLVSVAGWRYGGRLHELRKSGLTIHSVPAGALWRYRLDSLGGSNPECVGPCCADRKAGKP